MILTFIPPVTNRDLVDVQFAHDNPNSPTENIGARDWRFFHRVYNNLEYIHYELRLKMHRPTRLVGSSDFWLNNSAFIPTVSSINIVRQDIENLRLFLVRIEVGEEIPITPELSWSKFSQWNLIEEIILMMYELLDDVPYRHPLLKTVGEVGMTARSFAPYGCYLLPIDINQGADPVLYTYARQQIDLGNQLFESLGASIRIRNPQFPVGRIANDTDFGVLGRTGGVRTVTLTAAQMPAHTHTQNSHNHTQNGHNHTQNGHNHTQNAHTHTQNPHYHTIIGSRTAQYSFPYSGTNATTEGAPSYGTTATNQNATPTNNANTATNNANTATNIAFTAINQNTGGGGAHTNLPPYTVVNYWIYRGI